MATQLVAIDDFLIDCSLNENHTFESQVTEYPVESGSSITDNVRPMPIVVEMECLVSNTPIGLMATFRNTLRSDDNPNPPTLPSEDAYAKLQRIRDNRKKVTITTSLRSFDNMVLKNLSIPRAPGRGDELRFTATFQQIQTVDNVRSIRVSPPNATGKKKVTKTPEATDITMIRIDTFYHEWYDPEFGYWRRSAFFVNEVLDQTSTVSTVASYWRLKRGAISPFGDEIGATSFLGAVVSTGTRAIAIHNRNIILVPLTKCVTSNFIVGKPSREVVQIQQTAIGHRTN